MSFGHTHEGVARRVDPGMLCICMGLWHHDREPEVRGSIKLVLTTLEEGGEHKLKMGVEFHSSSFRYSTV